MNENNLKKEKMHKTKLNWYHWLVVILSLLLTFFAWDISSKQSQKQNQIKFNYQAAQITKLVKERMSHYEDALRSGVAVIHFNELKMDFNKWHKFAKNLSIEKRYPGINGIGIIDHLTHKTLPTYLDEQKEDRPNFLIYPPHEFDEFWPITYVEPVAENKQAIGLDMAHEKNRRDAAEKARDSGEAQITDAIFLVQDKEKTPGFLFFVPYFKQVLVPSSIEERRSSFKGIVYAPFIMRKLMKGTLRNKNRLVNFKITTGETVLYNELTSASEDFDNSATHSKNIAIDIYGQTWDFKVQSSILFNQQQGNQRSLIILIAGIVIDFLLIILFYIFAGTNKKAVNLANEMIMRREEKERELLLQQFALDEHAIVSKTDAKGIISYVNDKFCSISGYSEDELVGCNHRILNSGYHEAKFFEEMYVVLVQGKTWYGDICNRSKKGKVYWVKTTIVPFINRTGKLESYISIRTDITESKMNAIELTETHDILSFQVSQLQDANADLDQFAYVASHDLKSPLNGISQLVSWLDEDCRDILPEESKEHLSLLKSRSQRMLNLLNDLLEYSRIGKDDHVIELLNLKTITEQLFDLHGIREGFTCLATDVNFRLQRVPFEMVLRNLISNAIKHHDKKKGKIIVSYELIEKNNRELHEFKVCDDGPGIPKSLQEKAMEMFQTLQSRDETEGSGMGLAMVKKMVEKYDGSLSIDSDGKRGTTFIIQWGI